MSRYASMILGGARHHKQTLFECEYKQRNNEEDFI